MPKELNINERMLQYSVAALKQLSFVVQDISDVLHSSPDAKSVDYRQTALMAREIVRQILAMSDYLETETKDGDHTIDSKSPAVGALDDPQLDAGAVGTLGAELGGQYEVLSSDSDR